MYVCMYVCMYVYVSTYVQGVTKVKGLFLQIYFSATNDRFDLGVVAFDSLGRGKFMTKFPGHGFADHRNGIETRKIDRFSTVHALENLVREEEPKGSVATWPIITQWRGVLENLVSASHRSPHRGTHEKNSHQPRKAS